MGAGLGPSALPPRSGLNSAFESSNYTALEMVRKLQGVTAANYRRLADALPSFAHLARMTEQELATYLGPGGARQLHGFLHKRPQKGRAVGGGGAAGGYL